MAHMSEHKRMLLSLSLYIPAKPEMLENLRFSKKPSFFLVVREFLRRKKKYENSSFGESSVMFLSAAFFLGTSDANVSSQCR